MVRITADINQRDSRIKRVNFERECDVSFKNINKILEDGNNNKPLILAGDIVTDTHAPRKIRKTGRLK